jgi:hypothetical protein
MKGACHHKGKSRLPVNFCRVCGLRTPLSAAAAVWCGISDPCGTCIACIPGQLCPCPIHRTITTDNSSSSTSNCCNRVCGSFLPAELAPALEDRNNPFCVSAARGLRIFGQFTALDNSIEMFRGTKRWQQATAGSSLLAPMCFRD